MKWRLLFFLILVSWVGCNKTYRVAKPSKPQLFRQTFTASPNDIYYALRWALKSYGYPIAEEDLQNGVIKTRYVPVKADSHYISVFRRRDFGVSGAYHQLEIRLVPKESSTEVQVGSRVQGVVDRLTSTGKEENLCLARIASYLRSQNIQVTNLGVKE